jgi:acyl carrier protein
MSVSNEGEVLARLRDMMCDALRLAPEEFRTDLRRDEVPTWDSLGVLALGVAIEETFGVHPSAEEAVALDGVPAVIEFLRARGISVA